MATRNSECIANDRSVCISRRLAYVCGEYLEPPPAWEHTPCARPSFVRTREALEIFCRCMPIHASVLPREEWSHGCHCIVLRLWCDTTGEVFRKCAREECSATHSEQHIEIGSRASRGDCDALLRDERAMVDTMIQEYERYAGFSIS